MQGARPLFFLDYLATGRLAPDVAEQIVAGIARGCRANGCALLGGETAEMPGFYAAGEYDLAGFIVGAVDRARIVNGATLQPGDALIGLPSTGLHTNGYSLARRIVFDELKLTVESALPGVGTTVADALLAVHRSYLRVIEPLLAAPGLVKGLAHITGGGITDNLPRIFPTGVAAQHRPPRVGGAGLVPIPRRGGPGPCRRHVPLVQHGDRPDRRLPRGRRLARDVRARGAGRDSSRDRRADSGRSRSVIGTRDRGREPR